MKMQNQMMEDSDAVQRFLNQQPMQMSNRAAAVDQDMYPQRGQDYNADGQEISGAAAMPQATPNKQEDFVHLLQNYGNGQSPDFQALMNMYQQQNQPEPEKKGWPAIMDLLSKTAPKYIQGIYEGKGGWGALAEGIGGAGQEISAEKEARNKEAKEAKKKTNADLLKMAEDQRKYSLEAMKAESDIAKDKRSMQSADVMDSLHRAQIGKVNAEIGEIGKSSKDSFTAEEKLRKEYNSLSKGFDVVQNGFDKVVAAAKKPSPANDIAMLYGYMKMLDPTSVVRESEYANAENAAGVPDQIRQQWNKVLSGEKLSQSQRDDFVQSAGVLFDSQLTNQEEIANRYKSLANNYGVSHENVVPKLRSGTQPSAEPQEAPAQNPYANMSLEEKKKLLQQLEAK